MSSNNEISELQPQVESRLSLSASSVFADALTTQVNQPDVEAMIQAQKHMMLRFEKTNEMLINCNALSTVRYHAFSQEFKRHTQLLLDMKKDLESVYKRIRILKHKFASMYPHAFGACSRVKEEDTEEAIVAVATTSSIKPEPSSSKENDVDKSAYEKTYQKASTSSSCSQTTTPSPTNSPSTSDSG